MSAPTLHGSSQAKFASIIAAVSLLLLVLRYTVPLFLFDVPLGYDAGIYRYLFAHYAEALAQFSLPELAPWAQEHPAGLFIMTSPLLWLGVSPDMLIGWVWNLFPVLLLVVYALVVRRTHGSLPAAALLLLGLLSQAYYDGFVAMYWKTYVSLLFAVLAYDAFDRRSWSFYLFAFLALIVHHQTGLVVALAVGTWWLLSVRTGFRDPFWRSMTVLCVLLALVLFAVYARQWERAFWSPLKSVFLLRGDDAPGGAFPDTLFYLRTGAFTLALGAYGFVKSLRKKPDLWQLSVLWCMVFIVLRLVFYCRFFLQLDFFLLPFAALAFVTVWQRYSAFLVRSLLVLALVVQAAVSVQASMLRLPVFSSARLQEVLVLEKTLPREAAVIALENQSGPWLRGWLPHHRVGAPGFLDYPPWTYQQWETFLYGTRTQRGELLSALEGDIYFYITPMFTRYYGDHVTEFFADPCLVKVEGLPLLRSECSAPRP